MPVLHHLVEIAGETPSFLLPVFRSRPGANQDLLQIIDKNNNVASFESVLTRHASAQNVEVDIMIDIGDAAIWAFRDDRLEVHIGTAEKIKALGLRLLAEKALVDFPMAAAELASFCDAEIQFADTLRIAFSALSKQSRRGAETWRDSVVLLPHVKKEIAQQLSLTAREREQVRDIFAIATGDTLHVFAPASIAMEPRSLPETLQLAEVFGITQFELHSSHMPDSNLSAPRWDWTAFGIGGIARHALTKGPFHGHRAYPGVRDSTIAQGALDWKSAEKRKGSHILVAIVPSRITDAIAANEVGARLRAQHRHAMNIRPIGFGTPRKGNPTATDIAAVLTNYSRVWTVAAHRQRQTGNYANSLSASNTASRLVRTAVDGLIECSKQAEIIRELEAGRRGLGLFGGCRDDTKLSIEDIVTRVLYTMLCEDVHLHSASHIVVLLPSTREAGRLGHLKRLRVQLGRHNYDVSVYGLEARSRTRRTALGFATGVQASKGTDGEFRDFCVSLLAGFQWNRRYDDGQSILLENEGEAFRIWPVTSRIVAAKLFSLDSSLKQQGDLILTNQTVTKAMRAAAHNADWQIIHYSELGRLMKREYRLGPFKDL